MKERKHAPASSRSIEYHEQQIKLYESIINKAVLVAADGDTIITVEHRYKRVKR